MIPKWFSDERKTVVINLPFQTKMSIFQKSFAKR